MRAFDYVRPGDAQEAVRTVAGNPRARFLAGGTNLVDHLKLGVAAPEVLVDVSRLPMDRIEEYDDDHGAGLRIGTNVRNSDLAAHPSVRARFPVITRALVAGASGQLRHQATTGGNLLQRTRCVYFQDVTTPCNKRDPGSGCSAIGGYGRYNAILGTSEACVTTHPSDLAVALAAVDATVVVLGVEGERRVPLRELHRLPGHHPERDTVLDPADLITAVEVPWSEAARCSTYRKVRDRASYAFALVSVGAALTVQDGVVDDIRIAWGGIAHKPWRAERAEALLRGRELTEESISAAVEEELVDAQTDEETAYKPAMLRRTTAWTLLALAEGRTR